MRCPFCGFDDSKVIDSRPKDGKIKRRRECFRCGERFTTFETVGNTLLMVLKKDGTYEIFDRNKLIKGIFSAIKKRPVTMAQVSAIADYVESYFANQLKSTASSGEIGMLVLSRLKEIDPVSYVRFASVYEDFTDVESFVALIRQLEDRGDSGEQETV